MSQCWGGGEGGGRGKGRGDYGNKPETEVGTCGMSERLPVFLRADFSVA